MTKDTRVPVTVVTGKFGPTFSLLDCMMRSDAFCKLLPCVLFSGFLGSGKTTFINYILSANHGKKVAIIENEVRLAAHLMLNIDPHAQLLSQCLFLCYVAVWGGWSGRCIGH